MLRNSYISSCVLTEPDGITGRVLRSCADQLAGLFTSIFNESLATSVVPTPFKKSVIIRTVNPLA